LQKTQKYDILILESIQKFKYVIKEAYSMKVTIAIDSFKGSLSTLEAGGAAAEGVKSVYSDAEIIVSPLADGGEGTVDAIISANGGIRKTVTVRGPLGVPVNASYGIIKETKTAVIEMASASGITLVAEKARNPLYTTTYGVGELIKDAISEGCRKFLLGIGGSATNDGGTGMLEALGVKFLDKRGLPIAKGAIGLCDLEKIDKNDLLPALRECHFHIELIELAGASVASRVLISEAGRDLEISVDT
jgi:glycerate kinase